MGVVALRTAFTELDIARGAPWPARYTGRTLRNAFLDRWRGREAELEGDDDAKADYRRAADEGDLSVVALVGYTEE